jgi:hypothetical protein
MSKNKDQENKDQEQRISSLLNKVSDSYQELRFGTKEIRTFIYELVCRAIKGGVNILDISPTAQTDSISVEVMTGSKEFRTLLFDDYGFVKVVYFSKDKSKEKVTPYPIDDIDIIFLIKILK